MDTNERGDGVAGGARGRSVVRDTCNRYAAPAGKGRSVVAGDEAAIKSTVVCQLVDGMGLTKSVAEGAGKACWA